jgi:hypothetical protein
MMKVLLIEQNITKSSPLITLADGIKSEGAEVIFADLSKISTAELIKLYLTVNLVVIQLYGQLGDYEKRQLAIGAILGVKITRNWAGTDSLNVISIPSIRSTALSVNKILSENITTTHQGIVDELDSVGIQCSLLPQLTDFNLDLGQNEKTLTKNNVLVYLPSSKRKFYGADFIEKLIIKFPKVTFTIVADVDHVFSNYNNVNSMGWVNKTEMLSVWDKIGMLIRVTEHDGYPRMILEALGRGKYVIHNNPNIEGVWFADNQEAIETCLNRYIQQHQINEEGMAIFNRLKHKKPNSVYLSFLSKISLPIKVWANALLYVLKIKKL